jgi:hypothetical protein
MPEIQRDATTAGAARSAPAGISSTRNDASRGGWARQQAGWPIVTTLNVLSVLPLLLVSSFGWFLVLIGIADQGGTASAYMNGGVTLVLPWVIWLASVAFSQWLRPRSYALAWVVAALPLAAEIAVFLYFG